VARAQGARRYQSTCERHQGKRLIPEKKDVVQTSTDYSNDMDFGSRFRDTENTFLSWALKIWVLKTTWPEHNQKGLNTGGDS